MFQEKIPDGFADKVSAFCLNFKNNISLNIWHQRLYKIIIYFYQISTKFARIFCFKGLIF